MIHIRRPKIFRDKNYRIKINDEIIPEEVIPKVEFEFERASVKGVLTAWNKGGIEEVRNYLSFSIIYPGDSWVTKINSLINKGCIKSVIEEIKLVDFHTKIKPRNYNKGFN